MRRLFCCILFLTTMLAGCRKQPLQSGGGPLVPYYINCYIEAEEIEGAIYYDYIRMRFTGEEYLPYPDEDDERGDKFRELSARYGDTHYYQSIFVGSPAALCNEFTGIEVVSDCEFNGIPAGSSLGEVVELLAASAKPFLDSGYKDIFFWDEDAPQEYWGGEEEFPLITGAGFHPVYGKLSEISYSRLKVLYAYGVYLRFLEVPTQKHHTFTITFRDALRTMSCDVEYDF